MVNQEIQIWDFPCGPVVKNPPCNARVVGLIPGQGTKIPRTMELLSLRASTTEPASTPQLESVCCKKRSHMPQLRPDAAKSINMGGGFRFKSEDLVFLCS